MPENLLDEQSLAAWWHMGTNVDSDVDGRVLEISSIFDGGWRLVPGTTKSAPLASPDGLTFEGDQELLATIPSPLTSPTTVLIVMRFTEAQSWRDVIGARTTAPSFSEWNRNLFTDDAAAFRVDNRDESHAVSLRGGTWTIGRWYLVVVAESPERASLSINGASVDRNDTSWVLYDLLEMHVGCTGRSDNCFTGQIGELIVFTADLTDDTRLTDLSALLMTRWNVP